MGKKIKSIIYFGMIIFSFIILSFGNRGVPISENIDLWVAFGLINLGYWGFKSLMNAIDLLLGIDSHKSRRSASSYYYPKDNTIIGENSYATPRKANNVTVNDNENHTHSYENHRKSYEDYMPQSKLEKKHIKEICDSIKIQDKIQIISIEKKK